MVKAKRIRQSQRRGIHKSIQKRQAKEGSKALGAGKQPHKHRAQQMANGEELLGVEVSIGNLTCDKRSKDCADSSGRQDHPDLIERETAMSEQIRIKQWQPRAPDRVLQEHHYRQTPANARSVALSTHNPTPPDLSTKGEDHTLFARP